MAFESVKVVFDRSDITLATLLKLVSQWEYQRKLTASWAPQIATARDKLKELVRDHTAMGISRVTADGSLDKVHQWTVQGVEMARNLYRDDPAMLHMLSLLRTKGSSRGKILAEGQAWLEMWKQLPDADWNPTTENTQEAFAAVLAQAETDYRAMKTATATERKTRLDLNKLLAVLWADCISWYTDACLVFAEGTPEGDLVRLIPGHRSPATEGDDTEEPSLPEK